MSVAIIGIEVSVGKDVEICGESSIPFRAVIRTIFRRWGEGALFIADWTSGKWSGQLDVCVWSLEATAWNKQKRFFSKSVNRTIWPTAIGQRELMRHLKAVGKIQSVFLLKCVGPSFISNFSTANKTHQSIIAFVAVSAVKSWHEKSICSWNDRGVALEHEFHPKYLGRFRRSWIVTCHSEQCHKS